MEGTLSRASHPARGCLGERRKGQPNSHTCARSRGTRVLKRGKEREAPPKGVRECRGSPPKPAAYQDPPSEGDSPTEGGREKGSANIQQREKAGAKRPPGKGPLRRGPEKPPTTTGMEGALSRASHPARGCLGEQGKGQPNSHTCARSRGARVLKKG